MDDAGISRTLPTAARPLALDLLRSFGELRISALGSSMVPAIFPGDVLTIRRERAAAIQAGDIVLSARDHRFFIHRVFAKSECSGVVQLLTRGDALREADPRITEHELLGRVVRIERGTKTIPVRAQLTGLGKCLQWCVRRSEFFLRLVLHVHARRQHALSRTYLIPALKVGRSS